MKEAYEALKAFADSKGLPKSFRDDLTEHDKHRLLQRGDPPPRFGWVLRECGTEIIDPRMAGGSMRAYCEHYQDERHFYCVWASGRLIVLTIDAWKEKMLAWNRSDCDVDVDKATQRRRASY